MYLHYAVSLPVHWHPQSRTEKMKRLTLAIAFACVLTGVVRAGEIHTTVAVASPTPNTETDAGEVPANGAVAAADIPGADATAPQELLTIILAFLAIVS